MLVSKSGSWLWPLGVGPRPNIFWFLLSAVAAPTCDTGEECLHRTCEDYKNMGYGLDGVYMIDPDGNGGEKPFTVFCEMENRQNGKEKHAQKWWLLLTAISTYSRLLIEQNTAHFAMALFQTVRCCCIGRCHVSTAISAYSIFFDDLKEPVVVYPDITTSPLLNISLNPPEFYPTKVLYIYFKLLNTA